MPTWGRRRVEVERLRAEVAEQFDRADRAVAEREELAAQRAQLQEELGTAGQRAQQVAAGHAEATAGLAQRAEAAEGQVAQLRGELTAKDAELARSASTVEELSTELAAVRASLDTAQGELAAVRDILGREREEARRQVATRDRAQRANAEHADQVRTLTRRIEDAERHSRALAGQLEQADADQASLRREPDRVQAPGQERIDDAAPAPPPDLAPQQELPVQPEQPPPAADPATGQPGRPPSPQRQQPSRRRRGRPPKN
jgi:chromosome segregation protein